MVFNFFKVLLEGNPKKILHIYNQNFPKIKIFILNNKGTVESAEDVFQKALLQILIRYKKKPFELKTSYKAYLFTVCKNLWRRELNKSQNTLLQRENTEYIADESDIVFAIVEQERFELFRDKLNLLSTNCKEILTLFFAKTPYAEIIKTHNYSSETVVKQRVFKCKERLKSLIKKDNRYNDLKDI